MSSSDQGGYDISGSGFQDQPSSGWGQQGDQPTRRQQRQGQFDDSSAMGGGYGDTAGQGQQQQFQSSGGQGTGYTDDTTGSTMYGSSGGDVSGRSGASGYGDEFGLSQGTQSQYGHEQYGQGQTGQARYGQGQTGQGQTQSGQAQYDQSGKRTTGQKVKDFVKDTF